MRIISVSFAAVILLGVAWIISPPFRHEREFTSKRPFFEKVIADLRTAEPTTSTALTRIPVPDEAKHMAYAIFVQRPGDGRLAVEFLTGGGFPVKHRGFLFLSEGRIEDYPQIAERWPRRKQFRENWLFIGD